MKQKWIIFAMMLMLVTTSANAQPKHRHHQVADTSAVANTTAAADSSALEAFSDTTGAAFDDEWVEETTASPHVRVNDYDFDDIEDMPEWLRMLLGGTIGAGGIALAVFIILLVLLMLFAPFILIIIVLRMMVRRHNDRVRLAEKAMETGQQIPEELMPVDKQSDEYLRRRGIRNIWIGIGMAIMFYFWDADMLTGIGFLILCYGIGQIFIARSSKKRNDQESV